MDRLKSNGLPPIPSDVTDFGTLAKVVFSYWKWIIATTAACVTCTIIYLQYQPLTYEANMVVAPTIPPSKAGTGSLLTGSGISNLFNTGASPLEVADFSVFTTLLTSQELAARLEQNDNLLPLVFSDRWDAEHNTWRKPSGPTAWLKGVVKKTLGIPTRVPSSRDLADVLSTHVTISDIGRTGLKQISVRYTNANFALQLLRLISREADAAVRAQEQQRTLAYIDFLKLQLQQVTLNEQRQTLTQILAVEERDQMLTSIDMPFSFKLVEQPRLLPDPVEPQPIRAILLTIAWGPVLGILLVMIRILLVWTYRKRETA